MKTDILSLPYAFYIQRTTHIFLLKANDLMRFLQDEHGICYESLKHYNVFLSAVS